VEEVDGNDRVVGDDAHLDPGVGQAAGVGQGAVAQLHLGAGGQQGADQDGHAPLGQPVGEHDGLGAVVDDQAVAELVGQAQGGGDVVGPVAVLAPGDLALQDQGQRLPAQVPLGRLVAPAVALGPVVARLDQGVADHRGRAQAGRGQLLALAVDPLGVLPEGRLHAGGGAQDHLVDGTSGGADGGRLAADRVPRPGVDTGGQDPAGHRVGEAQVGRVDGVQRPDVRGDRVGELVGVLPGPAVALGVHAQVHVRVDQAGEHHLAGGVDPLDPVGDADVAAHRLDPAVADQDHPVLERRAGHGDDPPAHDRQPSRVRARVQARPLLDVAGGSVSRPGP
jgi:hypothetical protein